MFHILKFTYGSSITAHTHMTVSSTFSDNIFIISSYTILLSCTVTILIKIAIIKIIGIIIYV